MSSCYGLASISYLFIVSVTASLVVACLRFYFVSFCFWFACSDVTV